MFIGLLIHDLTNKTVVFCVESSSSYAGALSLIQALSLADLEIKLEAARKLLTSTFMRPSAPAALAKQVFFYFLGGSFISLYFASPT
jgi:hypothetical protein